jgi:hypothetical protein
MSREPLDQTTGGHWRRDMTEPTIDKDVPPPIPSNGRPFKYPFPIMEVGDSFAIPLTGSMRKSEDCATARLRSAAIRHARTHGGRFSIRTNREAGEARCWKVE